MNLNESAGDFMIYYSTNFLFYHNVNDCYEDPFQNLRHKISSAVMTKPFGVVKIESGGGSKLPKILSTWFVHAP